jgi:hypothetical protein
MKTFTLVINAGRSGSTYLYSILSKNFADELYVAHEDIPVQVSKPRQYNRAYDDESFGRVVQDRQLMRYIERWQNILKERSVIETGWTSYHLAPILHRVFGDRFQYAILHRHPVEVAASRAVMGNYHVKTFYDDAHEVNPFDPKSICPQKQSQWESMNHFEKCLYWWYVVYLEGFEFQQRYPTVPCRIVKSNSLFSQERQSTVRDLLEFLELDGSRNICTDVTKNPLPQYLNETFPLGNEWLSYTNHEDILTFARDLGYRFDRPELANKMAKYRLPAGMLSRLRHETRYWQTKHKVRQLLGFS